MSTGRLLASILLACVFRAGGADAATVRAFLQRDATDRIAVQLSAVRVRGAGETTERVVTECEAPGECELPLRPGVWVLGSGESGFYIRERSITVAAGLDAGATLTVSDTTPVRLTTPGALGGEATMLFRSADVEDVLPCERTADQWTCHVPRGTWDLQFRLRGHASHFFHDVNVGTSPAALGVLRMKQGASLAGRVAVSGKERQAAGKVAVTLTTSGAASSGQAKSAATVAYADAKGLFQFTGVAPGAYRVQARRGIESSATVEVTVLAGREALLREPLVVAEPVVVTVSVMDLSAGDRGWQVELSRVENELRHLVDTRSAASGIARFSVPPGSYELALLDDRASKWAVRSMEVAQDAVDVSLVVNPRAVAGRIRIGEVGIPAALTFHHGGTGCSIRAAAGEDGTFAVWLPSAPDSDPWRVEIASPALNVQRTIADARVRTDGAGVARLELDLPATRLAGRVVDAEGKPVQGGFVNVVAAEADDELAQVDIASDGEFAVHALQAGRYSVRALMLDGRSSEVTYATVDAPDDDADGETRVTLTVSADRVVRGVVTSDGGPVAGAMVTAMPTDRAVDFFAPRRTDGSGRFAFTLPEGSRECDFEVDAPGFALRLFHRRLESGSVTIPVHQYGGTLRLRLPPWSGRENVPHPWLIHDGAVVTAYTVDRQRTFLRGAATVVETFVEPGAYAVCVGTVQELPAFRAGILPAERCTSGVLAPFGELELDGGSGR
ncbi:MAG TPA: carboxypeptidase regulatory-like domain-containing protein [Thermoanaerobaculia bacterium]|nr:carboxypeptidase regulatory-like domain-containing protein [Thermoanaerobaculia bacterium]